MADDLEMDQTEPMSITDEVDLETWDDVTTDEGLDGGCRTPGGDPSA